MENVIIKKSKIHRKGVFAARNLKKGEIVLKWKGNKFFTKSEFNKLPKKKLTHIVCLKRNKYILMRSPEKYVNHSCNANTFPKNRCDIVVKNIKKGEEITSNYLQDSVFINFKCKCGSKNCKKIIK